MTKIILMRIISLALGTIKKMSLESDDADGARTEILLNKSCARINGVHKC